MSALPGKGTNSQAPVTRKLAPQAGPLIRKRFTARYHVDSSMELIFDASEMVLEATSDLEMKGHINTILDEIAEAIKDYDGSTDVIKQDRVVVVPNRKIKCVEVLFHNEP